MASQFSPDRWKAIEPLLDAAVELPLEQRDRFVNDSCDGDRSLRAELMQLLIEYDLRDPVLDRPAAENFPSLLDEQRKLVPEILIGRYRIERELGRGGMATVYLAHDIRHDRRVAVKVLRPEIAIALGAERFLAEIRLTAQLQHPHILPLHDSGNADGRLFYVMPYVDGESLRSRLERETQLPIEEAVRITCEVASALDAAHRHGVVHRDIKPENILLHDGAALVADFGIALALSTTEARVTKPGMTVGTPQYMSPEQAAGDGTIDSRADIYALGAVMYEMLAGEPPHTGASATAIIAKRSATPAPSVRILRPTVPASIDAAVTRALAREPVDRYRSAGDFAEALQQALRQDERGASPRPGATPQPDVRSTAPSRGRRSRNVAVVGLASLAVILSIASWTVWHRDTITALDANKIVIVPFGVTGADSSLNRLADAVAVNLAPMFTDEGGLRAVDSPTAIDAWTRVSDRRPATAAIARDVALDRRARYGLFGTIMGESGRLTLSANIVDARTGESRPLTPVQGSRDSVQAVLDRLVAQLLVRRAGVPERLVADLTSESLPALRAYLDGRAAYRRAHNGDAIRNFNRALDRDSTFALAALDLATATGKLLRQPVCSNNECTFASTLPGFRDTGPRRDDASFDRGLDLAWRFQSKLGPRDLPLLDALRGQDYPKASDAKATLAALERAAKAADDRAETQYLLGVVVLSAGPSLGYSDALARAEGLFNEARHLDSGFLAPLARLVDVSAYQGDLAKLRRFGAQYLAQDSTGPAADFVRWRVAVITNDRAMLRAIQARFDSLDLMTLQQIVVASQMSGVALEDADSAAAIVVSRATNPKERGAVLFEASTVALNRGRPHRADSLLRLRAELESTPFGFWHGTTWAALFGDGIDASAEWSARERREWLAHDTLPNTVHIPDTMIEAGQESLWDWTHGRMEEAQALAGWIRLHGDPERPAVVRRLADITDMLVAGSSRRADAATLRAVVDSESLHGCCPAPQTIDLSLASAYELAGDDSAAIRVLRRGRWGRPLFLTTFLLREGRLAERLGDRDGAIRAYEHYLALRSNPEPQLVPQRDSVRARVNALRAQLAHDQTLVDRVRRWLHTW